MSHTVGYFSGWEDKPATCEKCEWSGIGRTTMLGEVLPHHGFWEQCCPGCGTVLLLVLGATLEEAEVAVKAGRTDALPYLRQLRMQRDYAARREVTQRHDPGELPPLNGQRVDASFHVEERDSDYWLDLMLNGTTVHSELATWESIEPLERLLPVLAARYGDRLNCVDISHGGTQLYFFGDRFLLVGQAEECLRSHGFGTDGHRLPDAWLPDD